MDNSKKLTLFRDGISQGVGFVDISSKSSRCLAKILDLDYNEVKGFLSKSALISMILGNEVVVFRPQQDSSCTPQDSCCGGGTKCFEIEPPPTV